MRIFAVILIAAIGFLPPMWAQKTRLGQEPPKAKAGVDYPIKMHIFGIHVRTYCSRDAVEIVDRNLSCNDALYADALMNGMKIELRGDLLWFPGYPVPLRPGDYHGRLLKDRHKVNGTPLYQEYELVFPDRSVWQSTVTGFSE